VAQQYENILIVKPSSLGDVVMTLPVLDSLRRAYPHARISWVLKSAYSRLLDQHPQLDEVVLFPLSDGATKLWRFFKAIRRGGYDLVLDLQGLFRSGLVAAASGAPLRVGFSNARDGASMFYNRRVHVPSMDMHAVDRYVLVLEALGVEPNGVRFHLPVDESTLEAARRAIGTDADGPVLTMSPLTRRVTKNWPVESFEAVAKHFAQKKWRVIIVGGPDEQEAVERIAQSAGPRALSLAARPIEELVAIISLADVWLSGDTGPLHIADALGVATVSLYGSTAPGRTGPYRDRSGVIVSKVPCSPCFLKKCPHVKCMSSITVREVIERIERVAPR